MTHTGPTHAKLVCSLCEQTRNPEKGLLYSSFKCYYDVIAYPTHNWVAFFPLETESPVTELRFVLSILTFRVEANGKRYTGERPLKDQRIPGG